MLNGCARGNLGREVGGWGKKTQRERRRCRVDTGRQNVKEERAGEVLAMRLAII